MTITITPRSPECLMVSGDIDMELRVPFDSDEHRFHVAVSDGTLIVGEYDAEEDRFHFQVDVAGAGITCIAGEIIMLDWRPDWLTIAIYHSAAAATSKRASLPLFENCLGPADQ